MNEEIGKIETAIFGGGCFWCTEAIFKSLQGVVSVLPGYSGGSFPNPTYMDLHMRRTGHAEVIKIDFDPKEITFRDLLEVLFATHDPTTPNRQGHDVGEEYRSIILYTSEEQKAEAEKFIQKLEKDKVYSDPVVTEVKPFEKFYKAEQEHLDFYAKNPRSGYCQVVINPKLEKFKKKFAEKLKK